MSLIENHFKNVPDYYDWMYLDGYTPEEILYAFHRKMDKDVRIAGTVAGEHYPRRTLCQVWKRIQGSRRESER